MVDFGIATEYTALFSYFKIPYTTQLRVHMDNSKLCKMTYKTLNTAYYMENIMSFLEHGFLENITVDMAEKTRREKHLPDFL